MDGSGNVHVTGYFGGTVDFGAGDVATTAGDLRTRLSPNSTLLGPISGPPPSAAPVTSAGEAVAVDGSGNVHVAGYFEGTGDFRGRQRHLRRQLRTCLSPNSTPLGSISGPPPTAAALPAPTRAREVAVDGPGNVHVTGITSRGTS
ncbi:MAG: hypothetical protein ACJZ57_03515 [Candidatus Poriferisodalaceae bacterium]